MESLLDNKALLYSLLASGGFVVCMVTGSVPEINQQFEIVTFPPKVISLPTRMRSDYTNLSVLGQMNFILRAFLKSYSSKVRFYRDLLLLFKIICRSKKGNFKKRVKKARNKLSKLATS